MANNTRHSRRILNIFRKTKPGVSPSNEMEVDPKSEVSDISSLGFSQEDEEDDFGYEKIEPKWLITNVDDKPTENSSKFFHYSAFSFPGAKFKDEDVVVIAESISCYAVCDGHRSRDAAEYCRNNLEIVIQAEVNRLFPQDDNKDSIKFVLNHEMARKIIKQTFIKCHEEARETIIESGTTVALVWFYRVKDQPTDIYFVAANAGDARCLLGKKPELLKTNNPTSISASVRSRVTRFSKKFSLNKAQGIKSQFSIKSTNRRSVFSFFDKGKGVKTNKDKVSILTERLTYDHKATDMSEVERVEAAGGLVVGGCLEMVLQVTRGIGNHDLEPGFTPEPYISEPILLERKTKFLVLSSDGIFDKVTDEEVVKYVNRELTVNGLRNSAIILGNLALKRGALDDLSCIVLSLR